MSLDSLFQFADGCLLKLKPQDKLPVDTTWTAKRLKTTPEEAKALLALGYNIGYRIPDDVLVVDVDPRNGGLVSFGNLPDAVQKLPKTTVTPGGGFHIYTRLPDAIEPGKLRTNHKDFPGIDFLHVGKQVVMPGSSLSPELIWALHPKAEIPPPETPNPLLSILERETAASSIDIPSGLLTNDELASLLDKMNVMDFGDNDTWLQLAFACHHATDGSGLQAFVEWSIQDPNYAGQEQEMRARWDSMTCDRGAEPSVTIRSLCHVLAKNAGHCPEWLLMRAGVMSASGEFFQAIQDNSVQARFGDLETAIEQEGDHLNLITTVALQIECEPNLTAGMREKLLKKLCTKAGISMSALRKDLKSAKKKNGTTTTYKIAPANADYLPDLTSEVSDDQHIIIVANEVLTQVIAESMDVAPVYTRHQWWRWNGTYWEGEESVANLRRKAKSKAKDRGLVVTPGLVNQVVEMMEIDVAVDPKVMERPTDMIQLFAANRVITYNKQRNVWVSGQHKHSHWNTSVMPVMYDPQAREPEEWLKFLDHAMTSEHAKRSLACAIIYAASGCAPWLRKAFYIYGPKRSGKSTALDLIERLLGGHNCSSLNITQIGSKNGPAELVGKLANISNETVSRKTIQDDVFKALVSGEAVTVEKKFKDPFSHRNVTKLFFAANGFPKISDESEAVWDRLTIFSFPNSVPTEEADHTLGRKLKAETSQILSWAMRIFVEEYEKDECRSIMEPDVQGRIVMQEWRELNNPPLAWAKERLRDSTDEEVTLDQAYQDYRTWCRDNNHYESAKNHFSRLVRKIITHVHGPNGSVVFKGTKLKDYSIGG